MTFSILEIIIVNIKHKKSSYLYTKANIYLFIKFREGYLNIKYWFFYEKHISSTIQVSTLKSLFKEIFGIIKSVIIRICI